MQTDQLLLLPGREDPREMDGSRGHCLPQVHFCQRRLELWDCHVGSHVIWRETLLGYVQPRCECQQHLVATNLHARDLIGSGMPTPPIVFSSEPHNLNLWCPGIPLVPMFELIKEPSMEM